MMQFCERLLLDCPERLNGKVGPIHRAVLICVTSSSPVVRRKCYGILRRMVAGLDGTVLARAILKDLVVFLESAKIQVSFFSN